jgi:hypothetical protein
MTLINVIGMSRDHLFEIGTISPWKPFYAGYQRSLSRLFTSSGEWYTLLERRAAMDAPSIWMVTYHVQTPEGPRQAIMGAEAGARALWREVEEYCNCWVRNGESLISWLNPELLLSWLETRLGYYRIPW